MNPNIAIKVNSLKTYLDKEPQAAQELALYFYRAYLELLEQTEIMITLNDNLLQRQNQQQSSQTVELPPFSFHYLH